MSGDLNSKWIVEWIICRQCDCRWLAVAPVVADYLECPDCHHMNPAPVVDNEHED